VISLNGSGHRGYHIAGNEPFSVSKLLRSLAFFPSLILKKNGIDCHFLEALIAADGIHHHLYFVKQFPPLSPGPPWNHGLAS
jgi:hypothetical protein